MNAAGGRRCRFGVLAEAAAQQMRLRADRLQLRLLRWPGDRVGRGPLADRQSGGLAARLERAVRPGLLAAPPKLGADAKPEPGSSTPNAGRGSSMATIWTIARRAQARCVISPHRHGRGWLRLAPVGPRWLGLAPIGPVWPIRWLWLARFWRGCVRLSHAAVAATKGGVIAFRPRCCSMQTLMLGKRGFRAGGLRERALWLVNSPGRSKS